MLDTQRKYARKNKLTAKIWIKVHTNIEIVITSDGCVLFRNGFIAKP